MDSSYYLIANNTSTNSINNDFEQSSSSSSSSFNYDPFDGFSLLDQQGMRLYDYFGAGGGGGRCSPSSFISNQCPLDQLDLQHKNFTFQPIDPNQEDDDDLQGTLTSFVDDLGLDNDAGYNSGVDFFATNTIVDCSESTEAYYLRLALEQNNNLCGYSNISSSCSSSSSTANNNNYSDINNNYNSNNNNSNNTSNNYDFSSYNSCNGDSNASQSAKRSVLMNLLIDGSDVGAGYTSHNCRALPQKIVTTQQQRHHHYQYQQLPKTS